LTAGCKNENVVTDTWQNAYNDFLRNYPTDEEYNFKFALRDIDNNGVPELVLLDLMPAGIDTFNKCSVYVYTNGEVNQIGWTWLRYGKIMLSDNPNFPGLFTTNGSSAFHDCYITIKNNEFDLIQITDYDWDNNNEFTINDISDELLNEWIKLGGDNSLIMQPQEETLMKTYDINDENIKMVIF